jgi:hypothetical protein
MSRVVLGAYLADSVAESGNGTHTATHSIENWVNIKALQLLTHHTSAVLAAVVLFWFVGFIVQHLLHDGLLKRCVLVVDEFVLLCLFVYFAYELFIFL